MMTVKGPRKDPISKDKLLVFKREAVREREKVAGITISKNAVAPRNAIASCLNLLSYVMLLKTKTAFDKFKDLAKSIPFLG